LIEDLSLSASCDISDTAIKTIANCCKFIKLLDISRCEQLTDLALTHLADLSPTLSELKIFGCEKMTKDAALYLIRSRRSKLQALGLFYSLHVDPNFFYMMCRDFLASLMAESTSSEIIFKATELVQRISSLVLEGYHPDDFPVLCVVRTGIIPHLVKFLQRSDEPLLQLQAAHALFNVSKKHVKSVIQASAVPIFLPLLRSSNPQMRYFAIYVLASAAGFSKKSRDHILSQNAVAAVCQMLRENDSNLVSTLETTAIFFSNVFISFSLSASSFPNFYYLVSYYSSFSKSCLL
jgi:hypothetical protein